MKKISTIVLLLLANYCGWGQISITNSSFTYTQDFNSLATTGTANTWTNNSTLAGWSIFKSGSPITEVTSYEAGSGTATAGKVYSFGTGTQTDRALGSLASSSYSGWFAVSFSNNSNSTITSFTISYTGEQWRNGGNTSAHTMVLEYGFGSTFTSVSAWNAPGGNFNFVSPIATSTAAALDGNAAANRSTGLGGTINSLNWAPNETLWIRFIDLNEAGNDHGLAVDDFTVSSVTLPVSLINFLSAQKGKSNFLSWSTASEQNNSGFNIQRSTNGTDFENIGFVKSLSPDGNSSSRLDYTFTDYNPVGTKQYYRLKQTDFDGTSKYSAIVMVTREAPSELTLTKVYPNPTRESLYINAASPSKMNLQLILLELNGRLVGKKQVFADTGNNGFDISVAQLAPGTYILQAINTENKIVASEKFIKQ